MAILLVTVGVIVGVFLLTVVIGAPYIPSRRLDVEEAFNRLRPLKDSDVVLDLGGGDGAVCLEVCRHGASAVNYEINPFLLVFSMLRLRKYRDRYSFWLGNYMYRSFPPKVTIVYVFSESIHISGVYRKVQQESTNQGRVIDLISYGFEVPGVSHAKKSATHFLYRVKPLLT